MSTCVHTAARDRGWQSWGRGFLCSLVLSDTCRSRRRGGPRMPEKPARTQASPRSAQLQPLQQPLKTPSQCEVSGEVELWYFTGAPNPSLQICIIRSHSRKEQSSFIFFSRVLDRSCSVLIWLKGRKAEIRAGWRRGSRTGEAPAARTRPRRPRAIL